MRALVTGGAGFVGRRLCRRLIEEGFEVHCVDSLHPLGGGLPPDRWPIFRLTSHQRFNFYHEDCRQYFLRSNIGFDIVFHLAALVGGRKLIETSPFSIAENLAIDTEFWRWAERSDCGLAVYMSSSAVYPTALQTAAVHIPLREDLVDPLSTLGSPDHVYGWTKMTGERLMRIYEDRTGRPTFAVRPFSGYGEDQSLDYPFSSICARAVSLAGSAVIPVWGSGLQRRDFIHIDDCIEFIWRLCVSHPAERAVNLSSGEAVDFVSLAKAAARNLGYYPEIIPTEGTPEGVFCRVGDRTLQERLGLYPYISLEEGLLRTLDYIRFRRAPMVGVLFETPSRSENGADVA